MIKTTAAYEADLIITSQLGGLGFRLHGDANGSKIEENYTNSRYVVDRIKALERFAKNSLVVCDLTEMVL